MTDKDWEKILHEEDKIINNSNRKYRYHCISFEAIGESNVYHMSKKSYKKEEDLKALLKDCFMKNVKDEKSANALSSLTKKQLKVVELTFMKGYKQKEIAKSLGCSQANVSKRLSNALKRIAKHLGNT